LLLDKIDVLQYLTFILGSNDKTIKIWNLTGKLSLDSELVPHLKNTMEKVNILTPACRMANSIGDGISVRLQTVPVKSI
jgi:WD40 repeat protein